MSGALVVDLNREDLYDVEPAVDAFEATGPFAVELRNHGRAVHVHVRVDEALSRVVDLEAPNHFVDTESSTSVRVDLPGDPPPVEGRLTVVTGYGSGEARIPVAVVDADDGTVAVDEPRPDPGVSTDRSDGLVDRLAAPDVAGTPAVAALAALAVVLAGSAVVVTRSAVVAAGVGAVLAGVGLAAYLLAR